MDHVYPYGSNYDYGLSPFYKDEGKGITPECGLDAYRLGPDKLINLVKFLPDYLQETDVNDLVQFYEDFLNEMYSGVNGMIMTDTPISVSASEIRFEMPAASDDPRISTLEKIKRLSDLRDPDLIEMEYIQFLASYLGYNLPLSKNEIGGFGTFDASDTQCSATDIDRYTRFVIGELPHWYKIKTTVDMTQIMIYSFGLIGEIAQYYTKKISEGGYDENFVYWKIADTVTLDGIPDTWYPTPHYGILINIERQIAEDPENLNILNSIMVQGDQVKRAIEAVRPINTVSHNLVAQTRESGDAFVAANSRISTYIRIDSDGTADWWVA